MPYGSLGVEILADKITCLHFFLQHCCLEINELTKKWMFLGKLRQKKLHSFLRLVVNYKLNSAGGVGVSGGIFCAIGPPETFTGKIFT